jgi:DNA-binding transcriptional LysR family regulator
MREREMTLLATLSRTGSVTTAAEAMNMSQPAASAMLRKMEEQLGYELFTRTHRRLELTTNGRLLLPNVIHALAALESVDSLAASMGKRGHRRMVVGAVPAVSSSILPSAVLAFREHAPEVVISVVSGTALEIESMVLEQRVDMGLIFGAVVNQHVGSERLGTLDLQCVMRPDHEFAVLRAVTIDQLAAVPYVAHSRRLPLGALTAQALEQNGHKFRPVVEVNQFSAACAFTRAGCGVTVVESLTAIYAGQLGLCYRPIAFPSDLLLSVIWPLAAGVSSYTRSLMELVKQQAAWSQTDLGQ